MKCKSMNKINDYKNLYKVIEYFRYPSHSINVERILTKALGSDNRIWIIKYSLFSNLWGNNINL